VVEAEFSIKSSMRSTPFSKLFLNSWENIPKSKDSPSSFFKKEKRFLLFNPQRKDIKLRKNQTAPQSGGF
jgi:hypothetical protein